MFVLPAFERDVGMQTTINPLRLSMTGGPQGLTRTPGPPDASAEMKMTPACSSALWTASTFSAELRPGPNALSIRRIVGRDRPVSAASCGPLQSINARAARIWAAVSIG